LCRINSVPAKQNMKKIKSRSLHPIDQQEFCAAASATQARAGTCMLLVKERTTLPETERDNKKGQACMLTRMLRWCGCLDRHSANTAYSVLPVLAEIARAVMLLHSHCCKACSTVPPAWFDLCSTHCQDTYTAVLVCAKNNAVNVMSNRATTTTQHQAAE
jgi:hypothetical protein